MLRQKCNCDGISTGCTDPSCPSQRTVRTVEHDAPKLSYELVEGNIEHLQGQILTLVEATITDDRQLRATKDLVKGYVNDKLTHLFSTYGPENMEMPNYSGMNGGNGISSKD